MHYGKVLTFEIEGWTVTCHQSAGGRTWRCECGYFQQMSQSHERGFCPHVFGAIDAAMRDGAIDFSDEEP